MKQSAFHQSASSMDLKSATRMLLAFVVAMMGICQPTQATELDRLKLHLADSFVESDKIESFDADGMITFQTAKGSLQTASSRIVRFGQRPVTQRLATMILTDGSRITGTWLGVVQGAIRWDSPTFGTIDVPLAFVRGIIALPQGAVRRQWSLEQTILQSASKLDRLFVDEAGWTDGIVTFVPNQDGNFAPSEPKAAIEFRSGNRTTSIAVGKVQSIVFSVDFAQRVRAGSAMEVGFRDGSLLEMIGWTVDIDGRFCPDLAIPVRLQCETLKAAAEQTCYLANPEPEVRLLTDEKPASYRHSPQWSTKLNSGVNQTLFGEPVMWRNQIVERALAMPSSSQCTFRLDGKQSTFLAEMMFPEMDGSGATAGSVVAKVLVSRNRKLETVFTSKLMRPGDLASVHVDIANAELLVLLVEPADRGDAGDQLIWIEPRVITETSQLESSKK